MKHKKILILQDSPGRMSLKFTNMDNEIPNVDSFLKITDVEEVMFNKLSKFLLIIYDKTKMSSGDLRQKIQDNIKEGYLISSAYV
ncbi:hypothetical protein GMMP15_140032 [Candidatus Magnetomoraceae bacterium gMMP-15]